MRLAILLLLPAVARAQEAAGARVLLDEGRVEVRVGDAPLILSAPHGGRLKPDDVPDRTEGVLQGDTNTDLLALDFATAFRERSGRHAHVVICRLHRVKLDCNRADEEAKHPRALETWRAYHGAIGRAKEAVERRHGRGLYLDLHGHAHPEPRVELGYLLGNADLEKGEAELAALAARSSLRDLASRTPFLELLRGPSSFGALLERRGFACVPSPQHPHAGDAPYFSGGYSTRAHGSLDGGTISGIQLETPGPGVRRTEADRKAFAAALADAVVEYLKTHAGLDLEKP